MLHICIDLSLNFTADRYFLPSVSINRLCFRTGLPVVTVPSQAHTALYGTDVVLECSISAIPAHFAVYWQKTVNGSSVFIFPGNSSSQYSGMSPIAPALHISTVDFSDEATYVCFARNAAGTGQSSEMSLDIIGSEFCLFCCFLVKEFQILIELHVFLL